jgi:hypothetical protein
VPVQKRESGGASIGSVGALSVSPTSKSPAAKRCTSANRLAAKTGLAAPAMWEVSYLWRYSTLACVITPLAVMPWVRPSNSLTSRLAIMARL